MHRTGSTFSLAFALAAAGVLATSCFQDSCACVTVAPTREDRWIGLTTLRDSVELTLVSTTGSIGSISGTGVVRPQAGSPRSVTIVGATDDGIGSPSQLTITGWFAAPVNWVRTRVRGDSLTGPYFFPPATCPATHSAYFCAADNRASTTSRRMKVIGRAVPAGDGPLPAALREHLGDSALRTSASVRVALALGIVFNMSVKPATGGAVAALAVALGLGVVAAQVSRGLQGSVRRTAAQQPSLR